MIIQAFWLVE